MKAKKKYRKRVADRLVRLTWEFYGEVHTITVPFKKESWEWLYPTVYYTLEYAE